MTAIALLLAAAAVGFAVSKWLRVPVIPVLVLLGAGVAALDLADEDFLQNAVVLGLTFMVFVHGVDLNPTRVGDERGAAVRVGLLQFAVLGGLGFGAAWLLGFPPTSAVYMALALSVSSTLVAIQVLKSRRQLFEPMGRLVLGVLLLQDLLVILLIPVVTRLPDGLGSVATGLLATLGLVGLAGVVLRWVTPWVVEKLSDDEESLLMVVLAGLFLFLVLAALVDLPLVAGGFLAGVALSAFPANGVVRGHLDSLADFFVAFFFTALGAFLLMPTPEELFRALALVGVVLVATPPVVVLIARRMGFSSRPALLGALLLSQTSEFSLIVALQGVAVGHLTQGDFTVIAMVTVVTMMLTPLLATDAVTWRLLHISPSRVREAPHLPEKDHVVLLGCGSHGMALLEQLVVAPRPVLVVDDDPGTVAWLQEGGIPVVRGDASDPQVVERAGIPHARAVISTVGRVEDNGPVLERAGDVPVFVRAFDEADADWVRARGGRPILFSEGTAAEFLAWFTGTGRYAPEEEEGVMDGSFRSHRNSPPTVL